MNIVKKIKYALMVTALAVAALVAIGCSDGPEAEVRFQNLAEDGEVAGSQGQTAPDTTTPLFPLIESPAAAVVRGAEAGNPVVACDMRENEGSMQSDAYWDHLPGDMNGQPLAAYEYTWLIPDPDGSVAEIGNRLSTDHKGTSLLDDALPAGTTLQFRLTPWYGAEESLSGNPYVVPCTPIR